MRLTGLGVLSALGDDAWSALVDSPVDRFEELRATIEDADGTPKEVIDGASIE